MNTDMRSPNSVMVHHATRHLAWTVSLFVASLMVHAVARGATITNANDVTVNVELPGAWVGGVAPGASDTDSAAYTSNGSMSMQLRGS